MANEGPAWKFPPLRSIAFWMGLVLLGIFVGLAIEAVFQPRFALVARRPFDWLITLVLFVLSGAAGGMLSAVQLVEMPTLFRSEETRHWQRARGYNVLAALAVSATGGIGGSMASMFVMVLDGKIRFPIDGLLALRYISTGVITGFLGFQFLKIIANSFGDKFGAKYVDEKAALILKKLRLSEATTLGLIAEGRPKGHKDIPLAIAALEESLVDFPDDRRANIILAELYATNQGDRNRGIAILEKAWEAMKQTGTPENRAAIQYNLACYKSRSAFEATQADKEHLKTLALGHLRQALDLWPNDRTDAMADRDFQWLRDANDPTFITLVGAQLIAPIPPREAVVPDPAVQNQADGEHPIAND
jgi:hypothetical protein